MGGGCKKAQEVWCAVAVVCMLVCVLDWRVRRVWKSALIKTNLCTWRAGMSVVSDCWSLNT